MCRQGRSVRGLSQLVVVCALLLVAMAMREVVVANGVRRTSGSGSDDDGEGSGDGADDGDSGSDSGVSALESKLVDGDAVLILRRKKFWSPSLDKQNRMCRQTPFVFSKGSESNQNCLAPYNDRKFSCTCLQGFAIRDSTWEFRIVNKNGAKGIPSNRVTAGSTLKITKIAPLFLSANVKSVRIIGQGPGAEKIEFLGDVSDDGIESDAKLQTSKGNVASLSSVYLENIDLSDAIKYDAFFRSSLTNLTLRNCNLKDGSTAFLRLFSNLTTINLEKNKFTTIPSELLQGGTIKQVFLKGNPISSVTLDARQYQTVNNLQTLSVDTNTLSSGNCTGGSIMSTKNMTFCVSTGAPVTSDTIVTDKAQPTGTNKYLLIGAIGGCVVVALLLFLVVRRRSSRHKENAFVKHTASDSMFEETTAFDNSESQQNVSSTLLNDPIIITHRLPYNDIKVATCISRGGFGLVYSGTFNRRRVAIKKIRPELNGDIKHIESFLKEICLMASLNHPRIVDFIGVSWDSLRNLSAVTEFMDRGDLRDVLRSAKERNVRLSWESHKTRIAMHVAEALTYLHSLSPKVIHRDLKSKNILLDNEMTAKLSDFGVSRERRMEETHMTAGIGTAFWIAPEVLLGMDYDERADIFSFGVVLSEIDTNDYPYWNEKNPTSGGKHEENAILRMVATGALRPEFTESCPDHILMLADACLEVDPELRPTAAQIVYTLQKSLRASPLTPQSAITPQ